MTRSIGNLLNLGPQSTAWLAAIGIHSEEDLRAIGAVEAYCLVRAQQPRASLNLLYALEGALQQRPWNSFTPEEKAALQEAVAQFRFSQ